MKAFSITASAKIFKRSRNTIRDHLKTGKLSYCSDGKNIELSELLRVYGAIPDQVKESAQTVSENQPLLSVKDIEIARLQERVNGLENLLEEREKRILLLTSNTKKSWLSRFFKN